jgi:glycosyltransferase involved in cell wall biosynthesis
VKVFLHPRARGVDDGQGGIRRVVEGMQGALAEAGVELVATPALADVLAAHMQLPDDWWMHFPDRPWVAHCHGLYWAEFPWPQWAIAANSNVLAAIKAADAVTVPSEWVRRIVLRHTCRDAAVVAHGVDVEDWPMLEPGGYVYWDKTRPDPVCDPRPISEVAKLLPEIPFWTTFAEAGHPSNVEEVGRVAHAVAAERMAKASVYLATTRETGGVSVLEALASGVPVVGFDWGGTAELVRDGVEGYLVTPYDYPALARAIRKAMLPDPAMRQRCRDRARQYTWKLAAEQYASIYRSLIVPREGPKVSVVVPAYNLEKYLPQTLDSVAAQKGVSWECVVVDDASPDGCGKIADDYAARDSRFRVIHNAENQYLAGARNTGIAASSGKYILPLDADDRIAPGTLLELSHALDLDRRTHVAYGGVLFTKEDGETLEQYQDENGRPYPLGHSGWPKPFDVERQVQGSNLLPYASMFRKRAWELTGGYRLRCRTAEDADFWARLSSYGFTPRKVTEADTLVYRNRDGSMSRAIAPVPWHRWFGWRGSPQKAPAGANAMVAPPVPSLTPPALSVVIPVGPGHERRVQEAVDSVEAQTFIGWEVVVVNDSGNDLAPLPAWVRVIRTEGSKGVAHARNVGVAAASARLFVPLDADDRLEPTALEDLITAYIERPGTVLYSDFWEDPNEPEKWQIYRCPDWEPELLFGGSVGAVTGLVPVKAWRLVGGYDETLPAWEDWDFQIALADAGVCSARVAAPLWTYRKHTGRRREANLQAFAEGKAAILRKWSKYVRNDSWAEGATFMACSSCARGKTSTVGGPAPAAAPAQGGGGVAVLYDGPRDAQHSYRAPKSGTRYMFAKGVWKYVLAVDAPWLLSLPGFSEIKVPIAADAPTVPHLV